MTRRKLIAGSAVAIGFRLIPRNKPLAFIETSREIIYDGRVFKIDGAYRRAGDYQLRPHYQRRFNMKLCLSDENGRKWRLYGNGEAWLKEAPWLAETVVRS